MQLMPVPNSGSRGKGKAAGNTWSSKGWRGSPALWHVNSSRLWKRPQVWFQPQTLLSAQLGPSKLTCHLQPSHKPSACGSWQYFLQRNGVSEQSLVHELPLRSVDLPAEAATPMVPYHPILGHYMPWLDINHRHYPIINSFILVISIQCILSPGRGI